METILGQNEDKEEKITIDGASYNVGVYWTGEWNGEAEVNYCHVTHLKSGACSSLGFIMGEGTIEALEGTDIPIIDNTFHKLEALAIKLGY